jgi:hypothetical protein
MQRRRWGALTAACMLALGGARAWAGYTAGAAVESIDPTAEMIASENFYLGGYGLGSGRVLNQQALQFPDPTGTISPRLATGVMSCPTLPGCDVHARAVAFGDGSNAVVLAQIETQGYFVAYKVGPFGISDIRRDAAAAIAQLPGYGASLPKIAAGSILVDSNHSHGGPDTVGVWGGVPTEYLRLVHDQTVNAIVGAYRTMKPATLRYGTADASGAGGTDNLLANQFGYDPANQSLDRDLRVIQAKDAQGNVIVTYTNFSAHPTVLGSSNTLVTSDYTGPLSEMIASEYSGIGFDQVATLGRTQPTDRSCDVEPPPAGETEDICRLHSYANRVMTKVRTALFHSTELDASAASVGLHSYLMIDPATNVLLLGFAYAGITAGIPISRSVTPPWFTGTLLGAPSFSGHIGDVLIAGGPGEMYPQIVNTVRDIVARGGKIRGQINVGTAGDFLGYIIAPLGAYPEPIRRSLFDGDPNDPTTWTLSPVDNDNYFFNASHTFGERLICSLLRGAGETLDGVAQKYWSQYDPCILFVNDFVVPTDADTLAPAPPDLSALPIF